MKRKEKPAPPKRLSAFLPHALLLIALCVVTYANGLVGDFVWDDQVQLFRNTQIRSVDNIPRAFTTSLWSFMYSQDPSLDNRVFDRYYRPVQTVIYIVVYQLGGLSPFPYHLTNLILHCVATLLLYLLCLELALDATIALMAGALFAVHPVHTEAVTWIAGVGDLACGIFFLATLLTFFRYLKSQQTKWLWASSVCLLAALFSKEMAATFPFIAGLVVITNKDYRRNLKAIAMACWPYLVVIAIYAAFRITAVGLKPPSAAEVSASLIDWATLVIWVVGSYVRYAVIPFPLYIYHLAPIHFADRVLSTMLYAAVIASIAIPLAVWRQRLRNEWLWLSIFGVSLLPVLYFKGISGGAFFAERYLYIPSMAMIVAAAFALSRLKRTYAVATTVIVVSIFSVLTIQRNRDWLNEQNLYQRTVQYQPEAASIWTSLGEVYLRKEENAQAQKSFESALQHVDDDRFVRGSYENYRVYHGLGLAAARQARHDEAIAYLEKALEIYPQGDAAYTTLGGVLISQGREIPRAMALLEKGIQLNPVNDLARDYMGVAVMNQGQVEQAIQYFRDALKINPESASARQHLEIALRVAKQTQEGGAVNLQQR